MVERIPQSVALRVPLQAYLASDHVTPATGKTIAVTISKNGAAYGNPSVGATNATEIGSGSYYVDLSTTDLGTAGPVFVKGTEATIDNVIAIYDVQDIIGQMIAQANTVETGVTIQGFFRIIGAALGGKIANAGTTTNTFRNMQADSKDRITATVDTSGNRTAITLDMT